MLDTTNILTVLVKDAYGKRLYYPTNWIGKRFASLIGNKTISMSQLRVIESLGFEIEYSMSTTNDSIKQVTG